MRPVGAGSSELPIIVAVVAVGAEDLCAHHAALRDSVQVQHGRPQTRLRKAAVAGVRHWVTGDRRKGKLRNDVQRIAGGNHAGRQVSVDYINCFARTGSMAAEAIIVLIDGRSKHRDDARRMS